MNFQPREEFSLGEQIKAIDLLRVQRLWLLAFMRIQKRRVSIQQLAIILVCFTQAEAPTVEQLAVLLQLSRTKVVEGISYLVEINLLRKQTNTRIQKTHRVYLSQEGVRVLHETGVTFKETYTRQKRPRAIAPIEHIVNAS